MKNKIEIYILLGIIVISSLYIIFRKDEKLNYTIPQISQVSKDDITKVSYDKFQLSRTDKTWYISTGYRADSGKIGRIIGDLATLKVIDKISDSEDYKRFGLDNPKSVKVYKNDKEVINIDIGSTSSTGNYTYIKIPGVKGIYSIRGDIAATFGNNENDLRSKIILTTSNIQEVTVTQGDEQITKSGDDLKDLQFLNSISADTLNEAPRDEVLLTLSIAEELGTKTLIIYNKDGGSYPATSSDVDFSFTLPEYLVNKIRDIK